jgi:hypothetical protein
MCHTSGYPFDLNCRITLPVSLLTLVMFTSLELEDDDLGSAAIFDDLAGDQYSDQRWRTDSNSVVIPSSQYLGELNHIPGILICQRRDPDHITGTYSKLLTACADYCICHSLWYLLRSN